MDIEAKENKKSLNNDFKQVWNLELILSGAAIYIFLLLPS